MILIGKISWRWPILLFSLLTPIVLVWKGGDRSLMVTLSLVGILSAFLLYRFGYLIRWFVFLFPVLLFSIETPLFGGASVSIPGEFFVLWILSALGSAFLMYRDFRRRTVTNPLSPWVILLILSYWITSAFSTMPTASLKFSFINTVFILLGYLGMGFLLDQERKYLKRFFQWSGLALLILCVYSIIRQVPYQFNPGSAPQMARPFFKDHTILGAALGLWPFVFFLWPRIFPESSRSEKRAMVLLAVLITLTLILTTSRAAWVGLAASFGIYLLIRLGWGFRRIGISILIVALGLFGFGAYNYDVVFSNPYTSTGGNSTIEDQAYSITNFNTDVSNLERVNRWSSAWRMFKDRPWVGFGPGTYQFQYLPWQREDEMTTISVTNPYSTISGRGGSAHSEYLLVLSEMGLIGFVPLILILFVVFKKGVDLSVHPNGSPQRWLVLAMTLGITGYMVHGLFNNFLNTDKTGVIFWSWAGIILWSKMQTRNGQE